MLLEFSVANYLSFRDRVTLNLEAAGINDFPDNVMSNGKTQVLKSAAIYGANSSGKSNLLKAMGTMIDLIQISSRMSSTDQLEVIPFLLNTETEHRPSHFEVVFFLNGNRYRYGFEASRDEVHAEWLFRAKVSAEKVLFVREGEDIEIGRGFAEGEKLEAKTRPNGLFLSVVDQFNGQTAKAIMAWFDQIASLSGLNHEQYRGLTSDMLQDPTHRPGLMDFLNRLDLGFEGVRIKTSEIDPTSFAKDVPPEIRQRLSRYFKGNSFIEFLTEHKVFDAQGNFVRSRFFNLDDQESSGTNKIFDLLGPVFDVLLEGGVLIVDELNAKLHPLLTKALVALFNSVENNQQGAQLIFATHDTNLLSYGNFRRDQVYFTEKSREGATDLYSLIEYKENGETIRKDRSFEKDYIQGRYGAIPYLGNLSELFTKWQERQK